MKRVMEEHGGLSVVDPCDVRGIIRTTDWIVEAVQMTAADDDRTVGRAGKDAGVVTEPPTCHQLIYLA